MKKAMILAAMFLFVASSAFAATSLSIATGFADAGKSLVGGATSGATSAKLGKLSTGVAIGVTLDATNGAGYALVTQHKSGTKAFGSSYDSTAIYTTVADATPGSVILAKPSATDTASFTGTNWKPM